MREIGLALGVVESRVSQVHASAVVHLRSALKDLASQGPSRNPGRAPADGARARSSSEGPGERKRIEGAEARLVLDGNEQDPEAVRID